MTSPSSADPPEARPSFDAAADGPTRRIKEGVEVFRREGCLLLEDVVDVGFIQQLHAAFTKRHPAPGAGGQPRGSLRVGHQRFMITVRLQPPFTDARLATNPVVLGILTELLGADLVLFSFGAVVSQPGAEDQHVHSDGGGLFGDPEGEGSLPPYAITAIVPLVDMNAETGTTRVWPGSQRVAKADLARFEPQDPLVRQGSVLLMDYRIHHGGLANRSTGPRPILSLVFTRPWFRDAVNFSEQPPLLYSSLQERRMPSDLRGLLPADEHGGTIGRRIVAKVRDRLIRP